MRVPLPATLAAPLVLVAALAALAPAARAQQEQQPQPSRQQAAPLNRGEVEGIVRDYLLKNPEVVYEAIQELQRRREAEDAKQAQAALAEHRGAVFADATDPVGGNPKGDVTLVEFFDYRCGYCRTMVPGIRSLLAQDGKLRFVLKEIPILGPESLTAAKAALAAARQGRYLDMHWALMQAKDLSREAVLATAGRLGLDAKRLEADMEAPEIAAKIEENLRLAEALGINGTPAFVVGDQILPGAVEPGRLAELVGKQRASAAN